ncbi:AAA+ family ATPase [Tabrizicola sp.]|uniref:AAA+ family ATPase n=1 Tax=Tabrizicola sp. TaxID=2005166 RepID=UPI00286D23C7|nr:AAA+ family ATPase [Tabrizicola sp.]
MRLAFALCLIAAPVLAEDVKPVPDGEGFSLMQEGAKLVLRGLMTEMEPTLDEMGKALSEMEPALRELGPKFQQLIAMIDNFKNYDAPEMLPNGDIIIRRNAPLLPKPDFLPGPNGEVEL